MPKPQIIHIHGGNAFDSREQYLAYIKKYYEPLKVRKRWYESLKSSLWESVDVYLPKMPAKDNADYDAWAIAFEKVFRFLSDGPVILIGNSLGTVFLTKYLSENTIPKQIQSLHLVALVFDGEGIADESMANFLIDPEKLPHVSEQVSSIHLYHSRDDRVCPWHNVEKYMSHFSDATLHEFSDRWHFTQEEFPELIEQLKKEIS